MIWRRTGSGWAADAARNGEAGPQTHTNRTSAAPRRSQSAQSERLRAAPVLLLVVLLVAVQQGLVLARLGAHQDGSFGASSAWPRHGQLRARNGAGALARLRRPHLAGRSCRRGRPLVAAIWRRASTSDENGTRMRDETRISRAMEIAVPHWVRVKTSSPRMPGDGGATSPSEGHSRRSRSANSQCARCEPQSSRPTASAPARSRPGRGFGTQAECE